MTNYRLTAPSPLPSFATQEAKAKRQHVLAKAAQARKANYLAYLKKRQLHSRSDLL